MCSVRRVAFYFHSEPIHLRLSANEYVLVHRLDANQYITYVQYN